MNIVTSNKITLNQKDISKGQKILAAVYMVTNHLPESDPIRLELRSIATCFVCATENKAKEYLLSLETLLGGAVFAGLISQKNSSIISYEAGRFFEQSISTQKSEEVKNLFETNGTQGQNLLKDSKKTSSGTLILSSHRPVPVVSNTKTILNKSSRQETILSFINNRKSAGIKDIVSLFPDVSEKTVQRELNSLINDGKITKRGSKRWSIYMAVNSLL